MPYHTAASWKRRSSIPQIRWDLVALSAIKRGITGISYGSLKRVDDARRATTSLPDNLLVKEPIVQPEQSRNRASGREKIAKGNSADVRNTR